MGTLMQLAAATAAKGTKRPIKGFKFWNEMKNPYLIHTAWKKGILYASLNDARRLFVSLNILFLRKHGFWMWNASVFFLSARCGLMALFPGWPQVNKQLSILCQYANSKLSYDILCKVLIYYNVNNI